MPGACLCGGVYSSSGGSTAQVCWGPSLETMLTIALVVVLAQGQAADRQGSVCTYVGRVDHSGLGTVSSFTLVTVLTQEWGRGKVLAGWGLLSAHQGSSCNGCTVGEDHEVHSHQQ